METEENGSTAGWGENIGTGLKCIFPWARLREEIEGEIREGDDGRGVTSALFAMIMIALPQASEYMFCNEE